MKTKCGIYCRVSTTDQSTELQKRELQKYAEARGWTIVEVYDDLGRTGTNGNRPMFKKLLKDAKERKLDVVLCWKLDRFSRSLKDLVLTLQEFQDVSVGFVSLKDNIDLTTASGRLMMHLLASFAEFEASLIRERVCAGLENAKRKGTRLGRPPQVDPSKVVQLRSEGLSMSAIAKRLGCSKTAVHKCLSKSRSQNR